METSTLDIVLLSGLENSITRLYIRERSLEADWKGKFILGQNGAYSPIRYSAKLAPLFLSFKTDFLLLLT